MPLQLFIVPEIGTGTIQDPLRAKYLDTLGVTGSVGQIRYGFQPIRLVGADFTPAQAASLSGNSDVFTFPIDLTGTVGGGNVQNARNALELALIPAQWVAGNSIWMDVACIIGGMFQFMQRLKGYLPTLLIDSSTKLNVQWQNIPTDVQTGILNCAQSFGYSTAFITATTQIRVVLETFAKGWGVENPIFVGPVVLQR